MKTMGPKPTKAELRAAAENLYARLERATKEELVLAVACAAEALGKNSLKERLVRFLISASQEVSNNTRLGCPASSIVCLHQRVIEAELSTDDPLPCMLDDAPDDLFALCWANVFLVRGRSREIRWR